MKGLSGKSAAPRAPTFFQVWVRPQPRFANTREVAGLVEDTPQAGDMTDATVQSAESGRGGSSKREGKMLGIKILS